MKNSEKIDKLANALIKFQGLVGDIPRDATNELFNSKYASLEKILDVIKKPLEDCGLALLQMPNEGRLWTVLIHADSEQYISCEDELVPDEKTTSGIAAAISWARRIAIICMLRLNTKEEVVSPAVASANGPADSTADDTREWISEAQFVAIKARILKGEKGLVQKTKDNFQMKPELFKQLQEAEQSAKATPKA